MTKEECSSLVDLYEKPAPNNKSKLDGASYVVQFIWRDLFSKFDVIGPYYSLESAVTADVLSGMFFKSLTSFQSCGFKVLACICDGGTANQSLMKATMVKQNFRKDENCLPYMLNPIDMTGSSKIWWIICPSHEVSIVPNVTRYY